MKAEDIKIAEKIIDKHAEFTDHYADQEYTKKGILKMMEEYALHTEPVSEEVERLKKNVEIWKTIAKKRGKRLFKYEKNYATLDGDLPNKQ